MTKICHISQKRPTGGQWWKCINASFLASLGDEYGISQPHTLGSFVSIGYIHGQIKKGDTSLENNKWLKVSLEILVRIPTEKHRIGPYDPL